MTYWARVHDPDGDGWHYFEFRIDGHATRSIELQGSLGEPVAAATKAEWDAALLAGTDDDYLATFGAPPDMPLHVWEEIELEDITADDFETVWLPARAACEARARARPTPEP